MKKNFSFFSWINIAYCLAFVFCFKVTLTEAQTNLPGQTISVANSPVGISGENVLLDISYDTTDANNGLSGIGFRIHYDSSLLTFSHSQNALNFGLIVDAVGPYTDDYDLDNNPNTDNYISFGWTVLLNNWPSTSLPIVITQVVFTVNDLTNLSAISSTNINFTDISTSASHRFVATDYEMELITATWDVDGNEHADALTDGLILLRHAFELRGNDVTDGAIASNSSFSNFQVEQAIERTMQISDIDDNGEVDALTDILILLRYLFDLRGDGLIDGAVPENAERTTATEIEDYIANHMPRENILPQDSEENGNGNGDGSVIAGEIVADGVPPQLLEFTAINKCNNQPKIAKDDVLKIDIKANESLLTPVAEINGDEFQMTGQHNTWSLEHPLTNIDGLVNEGNISLVIKYKDTSGMNGSDAELPIGSELTFCDSENTSCRCFPESIEGVWKNANRINAMGVGPVEGSTEYWRVDGFELGRRACQFDDTYTFTADENAQSGGGLFSQEMDNNTWLEGWASPTGSESCGDPTLLENYPWDGLETGHSYIWNPEEAELSVLGEGAHIGIPRVTNGGDASTDGPASIITYSVATASFCDLALNIYAAGDLWWHFELERVSFPDPDNANIQYSLEDYPDYCSLGPDMFGSDLVVDMFGPVITISGDNPVLAVSGDAFVPPSATAYDVFDNATFIVNNIASNVDTSTPGTYTVIYTASDTSGNETTKNLTVIVEPDYQDEIVLFSNGSLADGWRQNGYDVDLSYGDCPGNTCPNLDYGIENDPIKGRDVMFIDHLGDNAAQAGFFMQTELNVDPIDLRGAEVNGKLSFEIWSDSPDGVDLNVAVDCPAYPNAGSPVLLEGVGPQQWQEISIPASSLFNESCASRSDEIGTINMFLSNWMGPKIRIDNVRWLCELSCNGSDIPDAVYTPWVKADKTVGFDAPNSYPGYNLVWSDEFDGTAVDQTKWNLVNAGGGFGNSELQYYRPENAAVEDGLLVITADIQQSDDAELPGGESFSSAKLTTQDKLEFKHGRVDIRAAVAEGKGFWSAAWMLGANVDDIGWPFAGEIDIVETIGGVHYGVDQENRMVHNAYWNAEGPFAPSQYLFPRQYQVAKYSPTPSGQSTAWGERKLLTEGETFSNTFHVFSIEWDEEKIRYMIDGVYVEGRDLDLTTNVVSLCPHGQVANEPQLSCLGQSYDNDFFLILNVAVGGTFPGAPDSTTQFPRGMLVDYVRVYQTADQQAAQ